MTQEDYKKVCALHAVIKHSLDKGTYEGVKFSDEILNDMFLSVTKKKLKYEMSVMASKLLEE